MQMWRDGVTPTEWEWVMMNGREGGAAFEKKKRNQEPWGISRGTPSGISLVGTTAGKGDAARFCFFAETFPYMELNQSVQPDANVSSELQQNRDAELACIALTKQYPAVKRHTHTHTLIITNRNTHTDMTHSNPQSDMEKEEPMGMKTRHLGFCSCQ